MILLLLRNWISAVDVSSLIADDAVIEVSDITRQLDEKCQQEPIYTVVDRHSLSVLSVRYLFYL